MRFYGLTLAASMLAITACGGNKDNTATTDSATTATTTTTAATTTDTGAMAAPAAGTAATATMAPATGATHEVKMIGDAKGYRFEPANITVKAGDAVKFINVSGGPHNVAFDDTAIPAAGKAQLAANMPNQSDLGSPLLQTPNEAYTISFANVAPGAYNYHCTPHLAMGMKGVITVQ